MIGALLRQIYDDLSLLCRSRRARNLATFSATVCAAVVFVWIAAIVAIEKGPPGDFAAFYCAGKALASHADPYTALALYTCEHSVMRGSVWSLVRNLVIPAPLPAYDLVLFRGYSLLPFGVALLAWRIGAILAIGATALALRALSGLPLPVVILATIPIGLMNNVSFGQPVPFVLAAIALCAWAMQRGNDRLAAMFACVAMIEPHVGLPGCLALLLYRPGTRFVLFSGAAIAVTVSVLCVPLAWNMEYFTGVLPQQAQSEITWSWQYSLVHALWVLGASPHVALLAGSLSYVVMVIAALVVAPRLAAVLRCPGLLIAYPAALAVFGGSYVHLVQIIVALPAAAILAGRLRGWPRAAAAFGTVLLTFSGLQLYDGGFALLTLAIGIPIAATIVPQRLVAVVVFAAFVGGAWFTLRGMPEAIALGFKTHIAPTVDSRTLAEDPWQRFALASDPGPRLQRSGLLTQIPTFLALTLVFVSGVSVAVRGTERGPVPLRISGDRRSLRRCSAIATGGGDG
jgi:hypothetical protein